MTEPTTIPTLHTFLRERRLEVTARRNNLAATFATGNSAAVQTAAMIVRDTVEIDMLNKTTEDLARLSRGANTSPVYRIRTLEGLLQDRLLESVYVTATPLVQAVEGEKQRVLRDLLRIVGGLRHDIEKVSE